MTTAANVQRFETDEAIVRPLDSAFMMRVFYGFAAIALLSVAISVGGKWFGRSIVMAGHTDDTTQYEIVIGNDVITAPANAIRFERSRRNGIAERLDLYFHWPEMRGYTPETSNDFNNAGSEKRIIFMGFEQRIMSRDMSGRFEPIYQALIAQPGVRAAGGLTVYGFKESTGYLNEVLAVTERPGQTPFVARCLSGSSSRDSLAPCERDLQVGDDLAVTYRFPRELLADWRKLDQAVLAKADSLVKTGR